MNQQDQAIFGQNQEILEFLQSSRLFEGIDKHLLEEIVRSSSYDRFPEGAEILRQGQQNDRIYFLNRGVVAVYSNHELILKLRRKGDIFGEMSVIMDRHCSASIVAETMVSVFSIPLGSLQKQVSLEGEQVKNLMYRLFSMVLAEKLSLTTFKARQYEETNRELVHTKQDLEQAKELFQSVIESSTDGIFAFDTSLRFTLWNTGMERIFGVEAEETIFAEITEVFPQLSAPDTMNYFIETLKGKSLQVKDREFARPGTDQDGYFEAHCSPLKDPSGNIIGGLGIVRDTTERKRIEQQMLQSHEKEAELRTAAMVQRAFLPVKLPEVNGLQMATFSQPASETGGDWYGFMSRIQPYLYIMIGDVTGHGVPAAMMTALVAGSCRTFEELYSSTQLAAPTPNEVLQHLNEVIYQSGTRDYVMTFSVARIDLTNGELLFSNAGHNFPLLMRGNNEVKALLNANPILGFRSGQGFYENRIQLEAGDFLLYYTDGLIENQNPAGEPWSQKKMISVLKAGENLSAYERVQALVNKAKSFFDGEPLSDDMTVLGIRVTALP